MKLRFTRKTWYALLLAACAASMANGFSVMAGEDLSFLEMCAYCATGMALLFLAAEKDQEKKQKRDYSLVFFTLLMSNVFGSPAGLVLSAAVWPALLLAELGRGAPVAQQFRLTAFAEALHLCLVLAVLYGGVTALHFWANLFWVLVTVARGWGALVLYKTQREAA